jgi:hypothetical protein
MRQQVHGNPATKGNVSAGVVEKILSAFAGINFHRIHESWFILKDEPMLIEALNPVSSLEEPEAIENAIMALGSDTYLATPHYVPSHDASGDEWE